MYNIRQYLYYILIGVMSFISIAFLPMLQSSINLSFNFPQTTAGWVLWFVSKLSVSLLNILIFHCFVKQGDINTKDNPIRLNAELRLNKCLSTKQAIPLSPQQFLHKEYGKKIPTVLITTLVSVIAFGPAILTFDIIVFTTYLFTVIMAIIFGVLEMKKVETYYIEELIKYVEYLEALNADT